MTGNGSSSGHDNVELVAAGQPIDSINAEFYGRFQYPWPPHFVRRRIDPTLERELLSQSVGEWSADALPARPRIWVAGCGTNQAVLTAVRFPTAQVLGSDVSTGSVEASGQLAAQLGVDNLELRVESINEASYHDEFDHVICTGVIHHNADPGQTLARLAAALRPDGLLELMVYNRYHCIEAIAVQKAVRILTSTSPEGDFDAGLRFAFTLTAERPDLPQRIKRCFSGMEDFEAAAADALIQPVMHTFTVDGLHAMARDCGLDLLLPCINQFDVARDCYDWNIRFTDAGLRSAYESASDPDRWQITNLVELEQSPMLWFYLRPMRSGRPRRDEHEILDDFREQTFEIADTRSQVLVRRDDGSYHPVDQPKRYPDRPVDGPTRRIVELVAGRGRICMGDTLKELGLPDDFVTMSELRGRLTTPAFPYLTRVRG